MFDQYDGAGISERGLEKSLQVVRRGREDNLQSRGICKPVIEGVGMMRSGIARPRPWPLELRPAL